MAFDGISPESVIFTVFLIERTNITSQFGHFFIILKVRYIVGHVWLMMIFYGKHVAMATGGCYHGNRNFCPKLHVF